MADLRMASIDFRRKSSDFLNSTMENANVNVNRFAKYLDKNELCRSIIQSKICDVEFDFRDCFQFEISYDRDICIPEDEECHIKACYDYLQYLAESDKDILSPAMQYHSGGGKYDDIIQEFLGVVGKPLIDFINDSVTMQMIVLEEEQKAEAMKASFYPNITGNSGTINIQGSGTINSTNTVSTSSELISLIETALQALSSANVVSEDDQEAIEDVRDDLEQVQEQLTSEAPKKSRLKKALDGIKKFAGDTSQKVLVNLAAGAITANWGAIIQGVQSIIERLPN